MVLLALLLPALPAGAVVRPETASSDLPFDPEDVVEQSRNHWLAGPDGLYNYNGRRRVDLDAWGVTFTPYVDRELPAELQLGFRLLEIRRGEDVLYAAPPQGGDLPEVLEDPVKAAYTRPAGVQEVYLSLDFAVEQIFILTESLSGTGDLVFVGALSTTLTPLQEGDLTGAARFPLEGGNELFYGPAVVRDAADRESPVALWLEAGEVRLTVPGEWLAEATYPVVVDPPIGSVITISSASNDQKTPVVAASDVTDDNHRYLVVWKHHETDHTVRGRLVGRDGDLGSVLTGILNAGDTTRPAVAFYDDSDDSYDHYLVTRNAGDVKGILVDPDGTFNANDAFTISDKAPSGKADVAAIDDRRFQVVYRHDPTGGQTVRGCEVPSDAKPTSTPQNYTVFGPHFGMGTNSYPRVACDPDITASDPRCLVVRWISIDNPAPTPDIHDVYAILLFR